MNLKNLIFVAFAFLSFSLFAQQKDSLKKVNIIKFNVSSVFEPIASYRIAYEYRVFKKMNIEHELSYIKNNPFDVFWSSNYNRKYEGFRIRNELKFFFLNSLETREGFYYSTEFLWANYNITKTLLYAMDNWSYFEFKDITKNRNIIAFHLKIGDQVKLPNSNIIIEGFSGIGLRYVVQNQKTIIESGEAVRGQINGLDYRNPVEIYNDNGIMFPSITFGVKIGLSLK